MTDDLAKQLRTARESGDPWAAWHLVIKAADRIEQLEALLDEDAFSQTLFDAVVNQRNKANARIETLEAALRDLLHAVCSDTGFAEAVRSVSGIAYPWPALDIAEEKARKALEGKDE